MTAEQIPLGGDTGPLAEPMPEIIKADARDLPLPDDSVDLVVTSPPYYALRSYTDGGERYATQIGGEATPDEYVDSLLAVTRECMRVLKPTGSLWVNLGDKYAASGGHTSGGDIHERRGRQFWDLHRGTTRIPRGFRAKSLLGLPWRYALRCIDELDLILRAEVIWSKPNGLPESVTDRVRRSHEQWFHFTLQPRYYSAVDEIREPHRSTRPGVGGLLRRGDESYQAQAGIKKTGDWNGHTSPLGRLPSSVWEIATQPLKVPPELGVDHFAAFPMEWPRRLILGWSPREVCTACGQGRRPVIEKNYLTSPEERKSRMGSVAQEGTTGLKAQGNGNVGRDMRATITGYACACPDTTAPATPGVVLDPFGGTGTTALVAAMHGRRGISVDASADYCRIAEWRAGDPKQRAKAAEMPKYRRYDGKK